MEGKVKGIIAVVVAIAIIALGFGLSKNSESSSLRSELAAANASLASVQDKLKACEDELATSQKALSDAQDIQAAFEQKEAELAAKDEELIALNDEITEKQAQLDAMLEESAVKEAEYSTLQDEVAQTADALAAAKDDLTAKEEELVAAKDDLAAKEEELAAMKLELETKEEEVVAANASLETKENERTIANAKLGEKEVAVVHAEAQLGAVKEQLETLQDELTVKNEELDAANETIALREAQLNDLVGQLHQLINVGNEANEIPAEEDWIPEISEELPGEEYEAFDVDEPDVDTELVDDLDVDTEPVDNLDVDTEPVDDLDLDTEPVDDLDVDTESADELEVDTEPVDDLDVDTEPADELDVDTESADELDIEIEPMDELDIEIEPVDGMEIEIEPIDETATLALIGNGEEPEDETVVAVVNGEEILYAQVRDSFMEHLSQYEMYGDLSDAETVLQFLGGELDYMVERAVLENKMKSLEIFEDIETFRAEAEEIYEEIIGQYIMYFFGDSDESSPDDMRALAEEYLNQFGYTVEALMQSLQDEYAYEKLHEYVAQDLKVDETVAREAYDAQVAEAMAEYAEDLTGFEYEVHENKEGVLYYPEGYRVVKHILLPFTSEQQVKAEEAFAQLETLEADDAARADAQAQLAEIVATLQPTVDEIMQAYEGGTDFNELIAQYGEDPGMEVGAPTENGYYVSNESVSWDKNFQDGAMALEKAGDVSAPITSGFGLHIIRYEIDVTPGAVPFEEVASEIEQQLLGEMADEAYNNALSEWEIEANIEVYKDRLVTATASEESAEVVDTMETEASEEIEEDPEMAQPTEAPSAETEEPAEEVDSPLAEEDSAETVESTPAEDLTQTEAPEDDEAA